MRLILFHSGSYPADSHVESVVVVCSEPSCGLILILQKSFEPAIRGAPCDLALDIGVLLRLFGLDIFDCDAAFAQPILLATFVVLLEGLSLLPIILIPVTPTIVSVLR